MATRTDSQAPQTAAFSAVSIAVAPGDTVFIYTDEATGIPGNQSVKFYYDGAGTDQIAFTLSGNKLIEAIGGYANLIAVKDATGTKIGCGKYSS